LLSDWSLQLIDAGTSFQAAGPDVAKDRWPNEVYDEELQQTVAGNAQWLTSVIKRIVTNCIKGTWETGKNSFKMNLES